MKKRKLPFKRLAAAVLAVSLMLPASSAVFAAQPEPMLTVQPDATQEKELRLWYDEPAPDSDEGWENWSVPLGGGYLGANVFGGTQTERIQITENSLGNPYPEGINNFAEIYVDFNHDDAANYSRDLLLNNATAHVQYDCGGVTYQREYFTSYPDKTMVMKFSASEQGALSFTLRPTIPYLKDYGTTPGDNKGKTGTVTAQGDTITLSGNMNYYDIDFEGQLRLLPQGGSMTANEDGTITLTGATSAVVILAIGTNYELESRVYTENNRSQKLAPYDHPHEKVTRFLNEASAKSYDELLANHIEDYRALFTRARVDLGGAVPACTTDELLSRYKAGEYNPYLEELYFQFGRYLLISSSRKGTLPGNLQGLWNVHDSAPWSAGYWHNINIQMNYWLAFNTNLAELFESYADLNKAFRPAAEKNADRYLAQMNADNIAPAGTGENGWAVGTGVSPYTVEAPTTTGHSGPGTGGLTSKLFWDYYDFTRSEDVLRETAYPTLLSMDKFLTKVVKPIDGKLLASPSASPEQCINGVYPNYYHTDGCLFDQQMIYENHQDTIKAAELLGITDEPTVEISKSQLDQLDPVLVGWSGQVKEYREENYYGEIGEYRHRHISQLVGLYPGQSINSTTPAWLDAAKVTLTERGDESTGWAMAHRLNLWARAQDGDHAYTLYQNLLKKGTLNNLWDNHPPFQIDGNYGGTAGVAEMLLQSHEGSIAPLAALPTAWADGSYRGLTARGNFEVGADWSDGQAERFVIVSKSGGECRVKYDNLAGAAVIDTDGNPVEFTAEGEDLIRFDTQEGMSYTISSIPTRVILAEPSALQLQYTPDNAVALNWTASSDAVSYSIYRAVESAPDYELVASDIRETSYRYQPEDLSSLGQCTFKVVAVGSDGRESGGPTTMMLPVTAPQEPVGYFLDDTAVQISFAPDEDVDHYNYYRRTADGYELVQSSSYSVACLEAASKEEQFAVSAVSGGRESDKAAVKVVAEYELENVLKGKEISLSSANRWVHDAYPLSNALDGDLSTRYAVGDAAGAYSIDIDLGGEYPLNELNLYEFKPGEDVTRSFETTVEVYSADEWIPLVEKQPLNGGQSTFDLGGATGTKLRVTFNNTKHATSASLYEITCSSVLPQPGDKRALLEAVKAADELDTKAYFSDSVGAFEQAKAAAKGMLTDLSATQGAIDRAVQALSDSKDSLIPNILYRKTITANPIRDGEQFAPDKMVDGDEDTRFAAYDDGRDVEVVIDLGGEYTLEKLLITEFIDGTQLTRSGETTISLLQGETWKTVVEGEPLTSGVASRATTVFPLDSEQASKIKFEFHNTRTEQRVSIYEIQAVGREDVPSGLDTKPLADKIQQAQQVQPAGYTPESYEALQQAIHEALRVLAEATEQQQLDDAVTALQTAIDSLEKLPQDQADFSILNRVIERAEQLEQSEEYRNAIRDVRLSFDEALTAAQQTSERADASQPEVDAAWVRLMSEIHKLGLQQGNKDLLRQHVDLYRQLDLDAYLDGDAKENFINALNAAEELLADDNSVQSEVDAVDDMLLLAAQALVARGDKSALGSVVEQASSYQQEHYAQGWAEFKAALDQAELVLGNPNATQQQIDAVLDKLVETMLNLRLKPDKSLLQTLIEESELIDVSQYAPDSLVFFQRAFSEAKNVFEDDEATQEQIHSAVDQLGCALDCLIPIKNHVVTGDSEVFKSVQNAKTGDSNLIYVMFILTAGAVFCMRKQRRKH